MVAIINVNPPYACVKDTSSCFSTQFEKSEDPAPASCSSGRGAVGGSSGVSTFDSPRTMLTHRADTVDPFRVSARCRTTVSARCILEEHS